MKKTIVKVLAIVFVVSILVCSMFVMTGAACNSGYRMYCKDGNDTLEITYNYVNGKIEVNNIILEHKYQTFKKVFMSDSDLKYNSKGYFTKGAIAVTSSQLLTHLLPEPESGIDYDPEYSNIPLTYVNVYVYTDSQRAPKKGDRVVVLLLKDGYYEDFNFTIRSISAID